MSGQKFLNVLLIDQGLSRRRFIAGAGASALSFTILSPKLVRGAEANAKINLGLIGCGGRGKWIADLFLKHGGYNLVAVADYFQDRADEAGQKFAIPEANRYSGLSAYKRLLEQELDAVAIISPPYFHPEQAAAAVSAGKHAYLAKPIAVDVPGCESVRQSGEKASQNRLCFLVDFQTRAHPAYQEVVKRVHNGAIGRIVTCEATYQCSLMFAEMDAEYRKNAAQPEARLRAWAIDRVLSGDIITEQNIHTLDVAAWFMDADPIKATGTGGRARDFLGNCWDHFAVIFHFPNDVIVSFNSKQMGFGYDDIMCRVYGLKGTADTHYSGKASVRSAEDAFVGDTANLYADGAIRNIAEFHDRITQGQFGNPTVASAVRSNLVTILGRTAAYKQGTVTWDELLRANEKFEFDPSGLRA
ncbi:MAG: Gfo/Idh/MocA family oxidoreductase [Candidatus Omnitrophica bacterium]|nr:Gfo/Idh/MocA family oxidoreductase [Candidatus Omnitrophota bacterium]